MTTTYLTKLTAGLTGGLQHISQGDHQNSSTSKTDYDMTPKRMVTTYLNWDTAHRILGTE